MHKTKLIILSFAMISSFAFADVPQDPKGDPKADSKSSAYEYECHLKTWTGHGKDKERVKCSVEGSLCIHGKEHHDGCKDNSNNRGIRIECSDGFSLYSKEVSKDLDDHTLWINAQENKYDKDEKDPIATLRVEKFPGYDLAHDGDKGFRRHATLVLSKAKHYLNRLEGYCSFESIRH